MSAGRLGAVLLAVCAVAELLIRLRFEASEAARLGVMTEPGNSVSVPTLLVIVLLCLLSTAPLGSGWPSAAAVVICAATVISLVVFGLVTYAGAGALLVAAYQVGRRGSAWVAISLGVPFLGLALPGSAKFAVALAALTPGAALAGAVLRASGEARRVDAARELTEGSLAEHMARGERARIARELHDVVAHHISMIAVQAETARLTTPGLSAAGAKRFTEIGDTARTGLTEMRRLLGVLRPDAPGEDAVADRRPQPGLAQLNELIDAAREPSGASMRLIVSGQVTELDTGVELAAFRIVQEALTNARRHAPGAAVDVELRFTEQDLVVCVRDNGPGPAYAAEQSPGHGLLGMRERAAAAGGVLRAGPRPAGGFVVEAVLPAKAAAGVAS